MSEVPLYFIMSQIAVEVKAIFELSSLFFSSSLFLSSLELSDTTVYEP